MPWFIQNKQGFRIEDGDECKKIYCGDNYVATVYEENKILIVDLDMDANFRYSNGEMKAGWLCEEHICSLATLKEGEEGTIFFQENRNSAFVESDPQEFSLKIFYHDAVVVPKKSPPRKKFLDFFKKTG